MSVGLLREMLDEFGIELKRLEHYGTGYEYFDDGDISIQIWDINRWIFMAKNGDTLVPYVINPRDTPITDAVLKEMRNKIMQSRFLKI